MAKPVLPHEVWGKPGGVCLLMIHPLGGDRKFWRACGEALGQDVMMVACDLPGSGEAPLPAGPLTLAETVAELERLREALGIEQLVVVGCAVGAMAAALYAATHPQRTLSLVMSNPAVQITEAASENLRQRARLARGGGMAALLPAVTDGAFYNSEDHERRASFELAFLAQDPEGYALAVLGVCGADLSNSLPQVVCPTLLVVGGNDRLLPASHAEAIAMLVPQAETVQFEDGAHFIPYQQPQRFAATLSRFLEAQRLR